MNKLEKLILVTILAAIPMSTFVYKKHREEIPAGRTKNVINNTKQISYYLDKRAPILLGEMIKRHNLFPISKNINFEIVLQKTLNSSRAKYDAERDIISIDSSMPLEYLETIVSHELGHLYCDRRSEEMGIGSWPDPTLHKNVLENANIIENSLYNNPKNQQLIELYKKFQKDNKKELRELLITRIISEGMASTLGIPNEIEPKDPTFSNGEWPDNIIEDEWDIKRLAYYGGPMIVKPIINQFGGKGIDYIITNPPEVKSLKELPQWRDETIKKLNRL